MLRAPLLKGRALLASARYKGRRSLGRPAADLAGAARRSWVVCPGGEVETIPILVAEGHLGRIRDGIGGESAGEVVEAIGGARHPLRPATAYELDEAVLLDASVYSGAYKHDLWRQYPRLDWLLGGPVAELGEAALATSFSGSKWFGHWLVDELPMQVLASRLAPPVGHVRPGYAHEPGYRSAFGIPAPPSYRAFLARKLIVVHELAHNADKVARHLAMREAIAPLPDGHDRIFLRRGSAWGQRRRLVNEDEIARRLEPEGFVPLDPTAMTAEEILRRCKGASMLVSLEGSHTWPGYFFMKEGGQHVTIHPPDRVSVQTCGVAPYFGLFGALFVGEDRPGGASLEISADPEELARFIDRVRLGAERDPDAPRRFLDAVRATGSPSTVSP
ncbi:glycosyltransferase 61 family protein [Tautonia plasticadhaerens]|uniref:Glycosyltransferase 61 catalytic domain-containing protein n=1 Tax=Tautonia plasticadhaerens TaxID=2527974 RepID=A0A518HCH2_9BACT|nr:glycosyltransferase family 61 protein [Tautonia plasticadhaerens]QDV38562.1 hypothetical protein ElP_65170 [Tautonia plasticadhaerens]